MQKYLLGFITTVLLTISTLSQATPNTGLYTVNLYDEAQNNARTKTFEICINKNNRWYIGYTDKYATDMFVPVTNRGHWFSKGNDIHFQSTSTTSNRETMSFHVTRINQKLLTGYFSSVAGDYISFRTITLEYKASCE